MYASFVDLEMAYDRVKLLGGIKSMYVDSLACIRVKGGENEWFRKDSGERQG